MVHIFLMNPVAGNRNFAPRLREEIAEIKGIKYYVFNSRYAGYETQLMQELEELFEEEDRIRVYSCGGSGTLKHILDGITDFNKVELACYPAGMSNDFLKVFGEDAKKFKNIQNLVEGKVVNVDYIESDLGRAINTFSTGLDADFAEAVFKGHQLLPNANALVYFCALISGIAVSRPKNYELLMDGELYRGTLAEIMIGNGKALGGLLKMTDTADVQDGKCHVSIIRKVSGLGLFPYLRAFIKDDKYFKIMNCVNKDVKTVTIKSNDNNNLTINMDGEIVTGGKECKLWTVQRGLRFVIPKGVELP